MDVSAIAFGYHLPSASACFRGGNIVKLSHFRSAAAIAEHGSLRAAARHLGIAQPTLTRGLSELEREIGATLFERRSRGMIATPLGEAFVKRATAILNDVRRAQEEVEQLRGNTVGELTVGLSIAAHLWLLPKVLEPFRRRFANVHLHIVEGFYPTLEQGLQDGTVDFYVGPDPGLRLPRTLRKDTLFAGRRAVLCRLKHPLARATSLKELVDSEWITTSITPKAEKELGALFKRHGLAEPKLVLRSQSALTLLTCLAHSDLLAMAPAQWTLTPFANRILTAIPVTEELSAPPIIAVRRADVPPSPAAGHLIDLIERAAIKLSQS
jgi:LysR family transcriptional regulator, regulator of abg operon